VKPFIAVIGGRKAGKSTVIQSLTGCPKRGHRGMVTDLTINKSIYVIASSPQEQGLEYELFKGILNRVVNEDSILGMVMAIQPTKPVKRLSLEDIFREVQSTGKLASTAVILHPPYKKSKSSPDPNVVRKRLKALNIDLHELDGRRFAHLNAATVRQLAQMP
jgi:Fe-S cluster assembly ATPase SufC